MREKLLRKLQPQIESSRNARNERVSQTIQQNTQYKAPLKTKLGNVMNLGD